MINSDQKRKSRCLNAVYISPFGKNPMDHILIQLTKAMFHHGRELLQSVSWHKLNCRANIFASMFIVASLFVYESHHIIDT